MTIGIEFNSTNPVQTKNLVFRIQMKRKCCYLIVAFAEDPLSGFSASFLLRLVLKHLNLRCRQFLRWETIH